MQKLISGGRICGRYVLLERIGSGGHGEIWRVYDEHEARELALKILHPAIAGSPEAWTVLQHEFLMVRRLSHPGILRTEAPVRDGDIAALPMEFAGAGDLRRLRGQSYLRIVPVLVRIAEVLDHAHDRGVVHRDLKPGNVLFDANGRVRLADFGAAGLAGSQHVLATGSPFSASPQQLRNERAAPADDIYGLGALAYELLSGYPPFYPDFQLRRVLEEAPAPLVPSHPAPARLRELIMAMLAKDPAQRPKMVAVIECLNATLSDTLGVGESEVNTLLLPVNGGLRDVEGSGLTAELEVFDLATAVQPTQTVAPPPLVPPPEPVRHAHEEPRGEPPLQAPAPRYENAPRSRYGAQLPYTPRRRHGWRRARWRLTIAGVAAVATLTLVGLPYIARWRDGARPTGTDVEGEVAKVAADVPPRGVESDETAAATPGDVPAAQQPDQVTTDAAALQGEILTGNTALAAGDPARARQAFERAALIDAGSEAAQRGLRESAALDNALARLSDAARAEQAGDTGRALAQYEHAARLAPAFAPAVAARQRAHAQLSERLEGLLAQPERLGDNAVYADALNTLERVREVSAPNPVLRSQAARLQILLEELNQPVAVALESDNSTSISIAPVGLLGSFKRRELTLRPGRYTVIGRRAGFREVRRDITVQAGQGATVVSVACTEPI